MPTAADFNSYRYEPRSDDLIRYQGDPLDEAIGAVLRPLSAGAHHERDVFRSHLDEQGTTTLYLAALRRTVHARRSLSVAAAYEALDAFALLAHTRDVPWDSWFKGLLLVARELGVNLNEAQQRFRELASEDAANRADVAFEAMNRVDHLFQCHIVETKTSYGTGMLETIVVRESAQRLGSLFGVPVQLGDFSVDYVPDSNLTAFTVTIADAIDASGVAVTSPLVQDQLVADCFNIVTSGSYLATTGCLGFSAEGVDSQPSFSVTVGELPEDEDDADELAAAADDIADQAAFAVGRRLILVSLTPSFEIGADEDEVDLTNVAAVVAAAVGAAER